MSHAVGSLDQTALKIVGRACQRHRIGFFYRVDSFMSSNLNPFIDPLAALSWFERRQPNSRLPEQTWLLDEVAQRLAEHLQVIRLEPASWLHWRPKRSGSKGQALLRERYPNSKVWVCSRVEEKSDPSSLNNDLGLDKGEAAQGLFGRSKRMIQSWWSGVPSDSARLPAFGAECTEVLSGGEWQTDLIWSNLTLHHESDPSVVFKTWLKHLKPGGVVLFSCLGPDTLQEVRHLYQQKKWPPAMHPMTDLHDWGDMLVQCGFSEPVMDMERLTLQYREVDTLLAELRTLGRNLHPERTPHVRTRSWLRELNEGMKSLAPSPEQSIPITFEVIYGHAFKPSVVAPSLGVQAQTQISLDEMRAQLLARKKL